MHRSRVSVAGLGRELPDRGLEREIDSTIKRVAEAARRGQPMVKPILSAKRAERERAETVLRLSGITVLLAGSEVPVVDDRAGPFLQAIDAACPDTFLHLNNPVVRLSLFKFDEVKIDEADCENGRSGSTSSVRSSISGDSSSSSSDGELNEDSIEEESREPALRAAALAGLPQRAGHSQPEPGPGPGPGLGPQTSQHPQPQLLEERPQEDELPLPLQKPCRNSPSMLAGTRS